MDNNFISFPITDFEKTKQQVLNWISQFNTCCFLDNNNYKFNHHSYECIAAAGVKDVVSAAAGIALEQMQAFQEKNNGWLFGHLAYDLKNETEGLISSNVDHINFPDLYFFSPQTIILISQSALSIDAGDEAASYKVFAAITTMPVLVESSMPADVRFEQRFSKQDYIKVIQKLQEHILRGDCYEINFCQEFFTENITIDPLQVFQLLSGISPSPFAAFYKINDKYLLCASPERYLKKEGSSIISQPIKGTGRRNLTDEADDDVNRQTLYNSSKDRAENVMVVDLVRNDLSRLCTEGSVSVDELFGVYPFPQVHQMISTISGQLQPGLSFSEIVHKTFPMGSMTGAPKKRVMELIEKYELTRRGIFSGAVGYITPGGDFDFNVVIRSLLYNQSSRYLSYLVGSGITFYSKAEDEYEECLLKAAAIQQVFALK